ncbi:ABC transporter ATP-binding protein [Oceanirhabdus sp. W0125-5]|uniref:ABC transporter ATP-binding protein n=1 Tax=Oceanirhabdus sp. W0125-5 TaxID=2999116 RepID=UPI0022F2DA5A|nr:ABC transporter ATP-binding protein [Oceanirhabdus sp. W0125-5]WBW95640.1 ABC transporter ATP-binding protein [Oceanirhabdus sp. W0125-5]
MIFLNKYIKKYWKFFCLAIVCLTVEALCDLMQPTIISKIVDIGVAEKRMDYVINKGLLMLMITAIGAMGAISRNIISSNVSQKFGAELRADLFRKIQGMSFENLDNFDTASLVTRLTNDVTQVQNFVNGLMRIFVKAPLLCIGSIIMAIRLNPFMSLIFLAVIPIVGLLIFLNMKIGYPFFIKIQKRLDRVNSVMREYLAGVRVVKAFNRFKYETERFEKSNKELSDVSIKAMSVIAMFPPSIIFVVNMGIVALIWIGGIRVNSGNMQVGQIIAFINYMTQISFSLMIISNVFTMFVRARASVERIGEVFNQENNMSSIKKSKSQSIHKITKVEYPNIKGKIDFENVYFSYSSASEEHVIKNISFTCEKGETVGIIGSTGTGKSTLVSLINRFYDVTSGTIKVDNINVKDMDMKKLRDKIALVPQNNILFSGTVIDNIRWGNKDAAIKDIQKVADVSQAHEFISSLPEGYNTVLGQRGVNLSGGQKQRISIARALIKKPEILILDDCTSAVDVTTEVKIREALKVYSQNLTCIVIAQRITSIMGADRIIVLDNGEIVGKGKHEDLIKNCNVYKEIFESQIGDIKAIGS